MNVWSAAFSEARRIAEEHQHDPFFLKKRIHDGSESDEGVGGFKQPRKLAQFMKENCLSCDVTPKMEQVDDLEGWRLLSFEERCAKQICRHWLKYEYLGLGEPCDGHCGRLHTVTGNPERLYKDFSFKGLNPVQRKTIIQRLTLESCVNENQKS